MGIISVKSIWVEVWHWHKCMKEVGTEAKGLQNKSCLHTEILHHCCNERPTINRLCFRFYFTHWTGRSSKLLWCLCAIIHSEPAFQIQTFKYKTTVSVSEWHRLSRIIPRSWKALLNFTLTSPSPQFDISLSKLPVAGHCRVATISSIQV